MPFIHTRISTVLSKGKEERIKTKLGEIISLIPGKTENWLMLQFEDQCRMYFKGDASQPTAFVEVKLFGDTTEQIYSALTEAITNLLQEELEIPAARIYVKYEPVAHWGWNGGNF